MLDIEEVLRSSERCRMAEEKERTSQIFKVLEGMKIWEAKELLKECCDALDFTEIHYKEVRPATTS